MMKKSIKNTILVLVLTFSGLFFIGCEKNNVEPEVPAGREIKVTAMFYPITINTRFLSSDTPIEHQLGDTATPLRIESVFSSADIDNDWEFVRGEIMGVVKYDYVKYIRGGGYGGRSYYVLIAVDGAEGLKGTRPDSEWIDNYFEELWGDYYTTTSIYNYSFKINGLDQKPSQIYYKAEHLYRYNESVLVHRVYPLQ